LSLRKNEWGYYVLHEFVELFNPKHRMEEVCLSTGCRSLKDTDAGIGARTWRNRYIKRLQEDDAKCVGQYKKIYLYAGLRQYLDEEISMKVKHTSDYESYYRRLTGQIRKHPALPDMLTEELTSGHLYRLRSQRKKAGLAHASINHELYLVSGGLKWLAETQEVIIPHIA